METAMHTAARAARENAFEIPRDLRPVYNGADRMMVVQEQPKTGAVSNSVVGTGTAQGLTQFSFTLDNEWLLPSKCYFVVRGHFLTGGNALSKTSFIGYCDNWVSTLFQQITVLINGQNLEVLQFPGQTDTAMLYASATKSWLKSTGSASGAGEGLMTRFYNSASVSSDVAATFGSVSATWLPCMSFFSAPAFPPGAKIDIQFTWAANSHVLKECAVGETTSTFTIDEFNFYRCNVYPGPETPLPVEGLIELSCVQTNVFPCVGSTSQQFSFPVPASTNKILIGFQDNNSANSFQAGQNGANPTTVFRPCFSTGAGTAEFNSWITSLFVNVPGLSNSFPNPTYTMAAGPIGGATLGAGAAAAGFKDGWMRAYMDWIKYNVGGDAGVEGSLAFGNADPSVGVMQAQISTDAGATTTGSLVTPGDINNDQIQTLFKLGAIASFNTPALQFALWGWFGKHAVFAIPIVRPAGKAITSVTPNVTFSAAPVSVNMFVFSIYTMGILVQRAADGRYAFRLLGPTECL